jgi:hypothetical protein
MLRWHLTFNFYTYILSSELRCNTKRMKNSWLSMCGANWTSIFTRESLRRTFMGFFPTKTHIELIKIVAFRWHQKMRTNLFPEMTFKYATLSPALQLQNKKNRVQRRPMRNILSIRDNYLSWNFSTYDGLIGQANLFHVRGNSNQAINFLNEAIKLSPYDVTAYRVDFCCLNLFKTSL